MYFSPTQFKALVYQFLALAENCIDKVSQIETEVSDIEEIAWAVGDLDVYEDISDGVTLLSSTLEDIARSAVKILETQGEDTPLLGIHERIASLWGENLVSIDDDLNNQTDLFDANGHRIGNDTSWKERYKNYGNRINTYGSDHDYLKPRYTRESAISELVDAIRIIKGE